MTELERLEKFKIVQERVNGPEAGLFKNRYDGRFFTGDMTFVFDGVPYNMFLYKGTVIDVFIGQPADGYNVGISGSSEQWEDFFRHRNSSTIHCAFKTLAAHLPTGRTTA